jgi:hypothetical protein
MFREGYLADKTLFDHDPATGHYSCHERQGLEA